MKICVVSYIVLLSLFSLTCTSVSARHNNAAYTLENVTGRETALKQMPKSIPESKDRISDVRYVDGLLVDENDRPLQDIAVNVTDLSNER